MHHESKPVHKIPITSCEAVKIQSLQCYDYATFIQFVKEHGNHYQDALSMLDIVAVPLNTPRPP